MFNFKYISLYSFLWLCVAIRLSFWPCLLGGVPPAVAILSEFGSAEPTTNSQRRRRRQRRLINRPSCKLHVAIFQEATTNVQPKSDGVTDRQTDSLTDWVWQLAKPLTFAWLRCQLKCCRLLAFWHFVRIVFQPAFVVSSRVLVCSVK